MDYYMKLLLQAIYYVVVSIDLFSSHFVRFRTMEYVLDTKKQSIRANNYS